MFVNTINRSAIARQLHGVALASSIALTLIGPSANATDNTGASDSSLPLPSHLSASEGANTMSEILAARRYAAFWNTGNQQYAHEALAEDFMDRTLPSGRPQGTAGPLQASNTFRAAVPDLTADIDDMVVASDRVSVHLHFKGHFSGHFGTTNGKGQVIDFQAFDLYRIVNGRIAENWHLEDNLTLLQQMEVVGK